MFHTYEKHQNCRVEHCPICDGGLSVCTVCKCIEGSLAKECPGYNCFDTHGDNIYNGLIDFVNGEWVPSNEWRGEIDSWP